MEGTIPVFIILDNIVTTLQRVKEGLKSYMNTDYPLTQHVPWLLVSELWKIVLFMCVPQTQFQIE